MNKSKSNNAITYIEHFDPSLVSEIIFLVDKGDKETLLTIIDNLPHSDIADIINLLKPSERESFVSLIKDKFQAEILSDLEETVREEVIHYLGYNFVANLLLKLDTDDAVHVIEDLEDDEKNIILQKVPINEREEIKSSLNYPDDSAGRLMNLDFVSLPPHWNVGQAIDFLRSNVELPNEFLSLIHI